MFADNMRSLTDNLTKKFGDSVTLHEPSVSGYDPIHGRNIETSVTHSITAVVSTYDSSDLIDGVIEMDDLSIMIYADSFKIDKGWQLEYETSMYSVIHVNRLSTQNKYVYYEVQVRRI